MKRFSIMFGIALGLFLLSTGCKKDSLRQCDEHEVAPCATPAGKANIRVTNVSDYHYCNVVINNKNYGIVKEGESTCYKPFDEAYRYANVQLYIGDKEFVFQPIDYVGETPLENGQHAYEIDVTNYEEERLSIEAVRE